MNHTNYWKLLGTTAILMTAFCVGIFLYARWDVQRFAESLGTPPISASQENFAKQAPSGTTVIPETGEGPEFVKQQEAEPQITDEKTEEASFDEFLDFLDELGDEEFAALLANRDITDTEGEAFAGFLQELSYNSAEKDSSLIVIESLDATQTSEWIELGDLRPGHIINLEDLLEDFGDNVIIIDKTGVIH
jgi:hypothetical protein